MWSPSHDTGLIKSICYKYNINSNLPQQYEDDTHMHVKIYIKILESIHGYKHFWAIWKWQSSGKSSPDEMIEIFELNPICPDVVCVFFFSILKDGQSKVIEVRRHEVPLSITTGNRLSFTAKGFKRRRQRSDSISGWKAKRGKNALAVAYWYCSCSALTIFDGWSRCVVRRWQAHKFLQE